MRILLKSVVDEMALQNLNSVWENMHGATWFPEDSEFTLDYICGDECALKCVESACNTRTRGSIGE